MKEKKVVLVTGNQRGIGKATIIEFASKGYNDYIAIPLKDAIKEK